MRSAIVAAALFAAPVLADDKAAVKEIPTKDLKIAFDEGAKFNAPTEIKSAEELAKNAALKGAADDLKKKVDFTKEKLVVLMWQGSGGDRVAAELKADGKKSTATFTHAAGLTLDLRQHTKLFAVPKDAEVKAVMGR